MSTPEAPTGTALQDRGGCLTPAGLRALGTAVAGKAPPALATHLAGCPRCQERVLLVDTPRVKAGKRPSRPVVPSVGRMVFLAVVLVLAIAAMLATLRHLAGGF